MSLVKKQNYGILLETLGLFQGNSLCFRYFTLLVLLRTSREYIYSVPNNNYYYYYLIVKWIFDREQWKGYVAAYHPIFMDGWSPEYPIPVSVEHMTNASVAGISESKKSRDEIKNSNPEVNQQHTRLFEIKYKFTYLYLFPLHHRENYETLRIIIVIENMEWVTTVVIISSTNTNKQL